MKRMKRCVENCEWIAKKKTLFFYFFINFENIKYNVWDKYTHMHTVSPH